MSFSLRQIDPEGKFVEQVDAGVLSRVFPREVVRSSLEQSGIRTPRERKLSLEIMVWLIIAFSIFSDSCMELVLGTLYAGLRQLWPHDLRDEVLPGKSAISYRRKQLGARPMRELFQRLCKPLATTRTHGAFLGGLRLMAIDGFTEDVLDTPENAKAFGRHHSDRGESGFPQVILVCLVECATHCFVDAVIRPVNTSEHPCALALLRSIEPGMLVMFDRGLHDYKLIERIMKKGAHVLSRLPKNIKLQRIRPLKDGSYLCKLSHPDPKRKRRGEHLVVRVVEYTINDPERKEYDQRYRLLTTETNCESIDAHTLVCSYHERWEFELAVDEVDTHQLKQQQPSAPLRSRTPQGVVQEIYGVLLGHYAIRYLMHEAALKADKDPDALSFTRTLAIIEQSMWAFETGSVETLPQTYDDLLCDIAAKLLPKRKPRSNPREVKRKMSKWPLKRLERFDRRQPSRPFEDAVALI